MNRVRWILFGFIAFPHILAMLLSKERWVVERDLERWLDYPDVKQVHDRSKLAAMRFTLLFYEEFRSLFYHRIRGARPFKFLLRPSPTLYLNTRKIGAGLFIQHGFATIVAAEEIGENCWITQQVTIGFNGAGKAPVIGNGVSIRAGAKVLGEVRIGDGSTVGANAVVTKDVPPNCVVVGVPAYIIRRDGNPVREPL